MTSENGKEFRSKFLSRNPAFQYLSEDEKYLFSVGEPKFKLNIIGTGMMGQEHMRVVMLEGRAVIHGIFDTNPRSVHAAREMLAKFFPTVELKVYESLEAVCNDPEVDGLVICTPNYTHLEVLRVAIQSGKHILLEKPMATTLPDAYEILQLAQNYPAVFQVGLQYRYKAICVETIHEVLERKLLGEPKVLSILEHRVPFLDKVKQWNKFSKYSGGTLVEKCCHYFDLLNLFAQSRPVKVFALGNMAVNFRQFEYAGERSDILDNAQVIIEYENGVTANFNLCMFAPMFHEEIIVCGEQGRLKATETENYIPTGQPKTYLEVMLGERYPSKVCTPSYPHYIEETGHSGATFYEHAYFIDNMEGKSTTTATVEEGFWSIVVGAAAEESVKTRLPVVIEEFLKKYKVEF